MSRLGPARQRDRGPDVDLSLLTCAQLSLSTTMTPHQWLAKLAALVPGRRMRLRARFALDAADGLAMTVRPRAEVS